MLAFASVVLLAVAAGSAAFGLRYLFVRQYLSYHADLTGLAWCEIPPRYQFVILGMLKIVGAGMLAFGIALAWLVLPFSRGENWATWAIFSLVGANGFVSIYVTINLRSVNPEAKTNVFPACSGVILALGALALTSVVR